MRYSLITVFILALLLAACADRGTTLPAHFTGGENEDGLPDPVLTVGDLVGRWSGKNSHSRRINMVIESITDSVRVSALSIGFICTVDGSGRTVSLENSEGLATLLRRADYFQFTHYFEGPGNSLMRIQANFRNEREVTGHVFFQPLDTLGACQTRTDSLHFKARNLRLSGD